MKEKQYPDEKKEFDIWIDEKGILNLRLPKSINVKIVHNYLRKYSEALKSMKGEKKVLVDMKVNKIITDFSFRKRLASELREIDNDPETRVEKAAVFGTSIMSKTVGNFVLGTAGINHKVKMFNTKDEALEWLINP